MSESFTVMSMHLGIPVSESLYFDLWLIACAFCVWLVLQGKKVEGKVKEKGNWKWKETPKCFSWESKLEPSANAADALPLSYHWTGDRAKLYSPSPFFFFLRPFAESLCHVRILWSLPFCVFRKRNLSTRVWVLSVMSSPRCRAGKVDTFLTETTNSPCWCRTPSVGAACCLPSATTSYRLSRLTGCWSKLSSLPLFSLNCPSHSAWCSKIGPLASLDAPEFHAAFSDVTRRTNFTVPGCTCSLRLSCHELLSLCLYLSLSIYLFLSGSLSLSISISLSFSCFQVLSNTQSN